MPYSCIQLFYDLMIIETAIPSAPFPLDTLSWWFLARIYFQASLSSHLPNLNMEKSQVPSGNHRTLKLRAQRELGTLNAEGEGDLRTSNIEVRRTIRDLVIKPHPFTEEMKACLGR